MEAAGNGSFGKISHLVRDDSSCILRSFGANTRNLLPVYDSRNLKPTTTGQSPAAAGYFQNSIGRAPELLTFPCSARPTL
jgi:hypothetical protein